MTPQKKSLAEITQRAVEVLVRELGAADAARFIKQFSNGHGDYTAEREAIFGQKTFDEIVNEIKSGSSGDKK